MNDTALDCPFCRSNGLLKGVVIAQTAHTYLLENRSEAGDYLIIPETHTESLMALPDTWWADVKELLMRIPKLAPSYNLSLNIGKLAGQSVKHVHLWIVPRYAGQPASGKGLTRLIAENNQQVERS